MANFVQTLETSLAVGSLYALIALGYTMVYGILKFINFAHGDVVVIGAWTSLTLSQLLLKQAGNPQVPPLWIAPITLVAAMLVCGIVGFLIERLAYRPLQRTPRINVLITAIGVSLLLQNVGQFSWLFGKNPGVMRPYFPEKSLFTLHFAGDQVVSFQLVDAIILAMSASLMIGLEYVVFRTRLGAAMRTVSFNFETASLMGIAVDRIVSITFVTGSMLAGAAGCMYSMKYPAAMQQPAHVVWVLLGLKAFVAAVIGGIGNVRGAVLGGFIIAAVEQFGSRYVSSSFRDVYVFVLLILILLVRPTGLLGSPIREKV